MKNLISSGNDALSKHYNNFWGAYSQTNMHRNNESACWEITGHSVSYIPFFYNYLCGYTVPGSPFITFPSSWNDVLIGHGLKGQFIKNESGALIIRICPVKTDETPGLVCPVKGFDYTPNNFTLKPTPED